MSKKLIMVFNCCRNCKHQTEPCDEEPCLSCDDEFLKWEQREVLEQKEELCANGTEEKF